MFSGLCGNPIILEVGSPSYLLPTVQRDKYYDIKSLLQQLNYNHDTLIIGAGAGAWPLRDSNCEVCFERNYSIELMSLIFRKKENKHIYIFISAYYEVKLEVK